MDEEKNGPVKNVTNKKFLEVQKPFFQKGFWPPEASIVQKR
jgi:hypothetical protein